MASAVTLVPYGELHRFIPLVTPVIWKSEIMTRGRSSIDDIFKFLFNGSMHLWIVFDDESEKIHGYVMTEIKEYPRCKMLVMQYCAGDNGAIEAAGELVFGTLESFAKDGGCAGIEFLGRPGWAPLAKRLGCTVQTIMYEKYFSEE